MVIDASFCPMEKRPNGQMGRNHQCLFAIAGPIPFIVVGEIFRQEPRAAAMSLSLAFNWICNFILMLVFPFMKVR